MAWCSGVRAQRPLVTLLFLSSINFLDSYSRYLISVSSIPYIEYSSYEYSLLSGALFAIVYAAGGVLISSHRFINRRVVLSLTTSSLAFSTAFLLTAMTSTFWQLAIIRAAMGLANSLFTPLATRILGSLFDESSRGLTFGLFNFSVYLSFAVCLSLGTFMYDEYGWKAGYLLFGFIGIVLSASLPCVLLCGSKRGGPAETGGGRFGSRGRLSSSGVTALASSASAGQEDEEGAEGINRGGVGAYVPRRSSGRLAVENGADDSNHGEYRQLDGESLGSSGLLAHATGGSSSIDDAALVLATIAGSSSCSDPMRSRSHTSMSPQLEDEEELRRKDGTYTPLETREHRDNNNQSVDVNSESSMRWSGERLKNPFFGSVEMPHADALLPPYDTSLPPLSQLEVMESNKKRVARASPAPRRSFRDAAVTALSVSPGAGDLEEVHLASPPLKPLRQDRHRDADGHTVSSGRSGAPVYVEEDFFDQEEREGEDDDDMGDDYEYDSDDDSVDTWTLLWPNYPSSGTAPASGSSGIQGSGLHEDRYRSVGSTATGTSRVVMHAGLRNHGRNRPSLWKAIKSVLKFWRRNPSLILLCLATGVRLGGGYVWSSYTSVFFSELYVDEGTACSYSNPSANSTYSLQSAFPESGTSSIIEAQEGMTTAAAGGVCGQDYPYCIDGICKDISDTPWHNQGMSHRKLESYISWVPLVGSGVGSVLGCMLSDWWVASLRSRRRQTSSSGSALASLTRPLRAVAEWSNALWSQPRTETVVTAAGVVAATAAGSSSSSSAHHSRSASSSSAPDRMALSGLESRALLVAVSCAVSAPFVVVALDAGYPDCFWFMVLSGLFGEIYFGITLTLLSEITPKRLTVLCVALFSLFSIIIATMVQLLIPFFKREFDSQLGPHTFLVLAAPTEAEAAAGGQVPYFVEETGAAGLQRAMKLVLFSAYLGGAVLYLASYLRMRKDLRRSRGTAF